MASFFGWYRDLRTYVARYLRPVKIRRVSRVKPRQKPPRFVRGGFCRKRCKGFARICPHRQSLYFFKEKRRYTGHARSKSVLSRSRYVMKFACPMPARRREKRALFSRRPLFGTAPWRGIVHECRPWRFGKGICALQCGHGIHDGLGGLTENKGRVAGFRRGYGRLRIRFGCTSLFAGLRFHGWRSLEFPSRTMCHESAPSGRIIMRDRWETSQRYPLSSLNFAGRPERTRS